MASVSSAYIQSIIDFLTRSKVDMSALEKHLELSTFERVSIGQYVELLNLGCRLLNQSLFGFELGKSIQTRDYGVLGYLVESCENLEQAIQALLKFDSLVADIGSTKLGYGQELVYLDWFPLSLDCKQMVLRNTTAWVSTVRKILGEDLNPTLVSFTFSLTEQEVVQLQHWFNCEVAHNAKNNRISFSKSLLSIPFTSENKAMFNALKQVSESELNKPHNKNNLVDQVKLLLAAKLTLQPSEQTHIAAALYMSTRTLQRKLKQQGIQFQTLLDEERKARLSFLLMHYTIAETAFELGYKEQSSFTHAFKKWHGTTPLTYQKFLRKQSGDGKPDL